MTRRWRVGGYHLKPRRKREPEEKVTEKLPAQSSNPQQSAGSVGGGGGGGWPTSSIRVNGHETRRKPGGKVLS